MRLTSKKIGKSFLRCCLVLALCLIIFPTITAKAAGTTYYISNSGSNSYDGRSEGTAWANFDNIPHTLGAGDTILLARGSVWDSELNLSGVGNASAFITISAYGSGELPRISRGNRSTDKCIVINGGSYWKINNIDFRNSRMGVYFRYDFSSINNDSIYVQNCYFYNINCNDVISRLVDMTTVSQELGSNNGEYVWPAAIFVGGKLITDSFETKVQNIISTDNLFDLCYTGIASDWYSDSQGRLGDLVSRSTTKNWWINNCTVTGTTNGLFAIAKASDSTIQYSKALSGSSLTGPFGTTGAFLQNCSTITVDHCEFSWIRNNGGRDGVGIDFEGNNRNIFLKNSNIHDNEGAGILFCDTFGVNIGTYISDCTLANDCKRPYPTDPGANYEIVSYKPANTGMITNVTIYKSISTTAYLSPEINQGFGVSGLIER